MGACNGAVSHVPGSNEMKNSDHHATLTEDGIQKLKAQEQGEDTELIAGVDYVVKEKGQDWYAFPDLPSTSHFRHTWILQRRRRARAPSFAGAPLPKHGKDDSERSAMIVMAYFHPWTLQLLKEGDEHVPHASQLRGVQESWEEAMTKWFHG